jgi:hypothetical protein
MFQFLRGVALIGVLILNCGAAFGQGKYDSANGIMQACRDSLAGRPMGNVTQGLERGYCAGMVTGIFEVAIGACAPRNVTTGQAVRVVVKYIDDRPERLNESFSMLAVEALRAAWPCKK